MQVDHPIYRYNGFSLIELLVSVFIFSIMLFCFGEGMSCAYLQTLSIHQQIVKIYGDKNNE